MNVGRTTVGIAVALGAGVSSLAMALAPAAPAWAGPRMSHADIAGIHTIAKSTKGSDPGSTFCKLEKASRAYETGKLENAATTALLADKWPAAQKDLLSIGKDTANLEKEFISALSSAPAKVKAAASLIVKYVPAEEKAIKDSTSAAQFEAKEEAVSGPKFTAASEVLAAYQDSLCGTTTSTT